MGGMGGGTDGFVDPDEGDPMELAPPAGLDAPFSPATDNGGDCSATQINNFRGWLVDRIGRPTEGAFGQICILQAPSGPCTDTSECASGQRCDGGQCATLVCLQPANTDGDGIFNVGVPAENNVTSVCCVRPESESDAPPCIAKQVSRTSARGTSPFATPSSSMQRSPCRAPRVR